MHIPEETVKRFQKIFEKDYSKKLSKKEAHEAAYNLLGFFDLLLKIDRRVNPQNYKSKKEEDLLKLVSNNKQKRKLEHFITEA